MRTKQLPPGGYPIAVKYIISYTFIPSLVKALGFALLFPAFLRAVMYQVNAFKRLFKHIFFFINTLYTYGYLKGLHVSVFKEPFQVNIKYVLLSQP